LFLRGAFEPGKSFTVEAVVTKPVAAQTLTLKLPRGMTRLGGDETLPVPPSGGNGSSKLAWQVRVDDFGKFAVRVQSSNGVTQTKTILIARADQNAGRLDVKLDGDFAPAKVFSVIARVQSPLRDQTLTLALDPDLQRLEGAETVKVPPPPGRDDVSTVVWKVKIGQTGVHSVAVRSSTGLTIKKTLNLDRSASNAGHFTLDLSGDIGPGKDFLVTARVTIPVRGQKLTLIVPAELKLQDGAVTQQVSPLPAGVREGTHSVSWRVHAPTWGKMRIRVESTTGLARSKVLTLGSDRPAQLFPGR
jgi:hypothetical protein